MLSQVAPLLPLFGGAVAAFERLRKDIETQPTIDNAISSAEDRVSIYGSIELRGVSFTYPSRPDHAVLRDISLSCEAGKLTAIVGLSGSGKSTIASLITRFYDPQSGDVVLDGRSIKEFNIKNLRGFISLVQQEPSLLDRSILENIALGLVNSPSHSHLEDTLLSGRLAQLAIEARSGQELDLLVEQAGPEIVEIVRLVRHAAGLADVAMFIDHLEFGLATMVSTLR